jgi:hypothetical protein
MRSEWPDCNNQLKKIQVIDRGFMDGQHKGLVYASGDATPGLLSRTFKLAGTVEAMMCESCSRVLFYAVPKE